MLDGVPDSAVAATVGAVPPPFVSSDGIENDIPDDGKVPRLIASIAGVPKFVLDTNSRRYCTGLNAGLVVPIESTAA